MSAIDHVDVVVTSLQRSLAFVDERAARLRRLAARLARLEQERR